MAIPIKPVADIAKKWLDVTPGRSSFYEAGVRSPTADWQVNTVAAASVFKAAISAADIEKRFAGGARRAGTPKWQRKSVDVGVGRFAGGVSAAGPDYQAGIAPYVETIAAVTLPARQPRGSDANYARVKAVGDALTKRRLALAASGG